MWILSRVSDRNFRAAPATFWARHTHSLELQVLGLGFITTGDAGLDERKRVLFLQNAPPYTQYVVPEASDLKPALSL